MKQIDLQPHEYRVAPAPAEPLFGPGWPFGAAVLVTILVATIFHDATPPIYVLGAILGAALSGLFQQFYR